MVVGFSELPENAGKLCLNGLRCVLRPDADHPFESSEHGKRARLGIEFRGGKELVSACDLARLDQPLGQVHTDQCAEQLVSGREHEGTLEQVSRGGDIATVARAPAGGIQMSGGAPSQL